MPLNTSTTPRFHAGSEFDLGGMAIKHMGWPRWRHACDLVLQPTLASASGSMRQPVAQLISGIQCRNTGAALNSINEVSRTTVGCLIQAIQAAVILNEVTSTRASALNGMGWRHRHFRQSERDFLRPLCGFIQHAKDHTVDRRRELGA